MVNTTVLSKYSLQLVIYLKVRVCLKPDYLEKALEHREISVVPWATKGPFLKPTSA